MRIWQIKEQVVEDPSTKLRLEFSSVYTDEVNAGNEPPLKDELVLIRLWTSDRTRVATFAFERNGRFVHALVEPLPNAQLTDLPGQGADVSMTDPAGYAHADEIAALDAVGPAQPALRPWPGTEPPAKPDEVAFGKATFTGL